MTATLQLGAFAIVPLDPGTVIPDNLRVSVVEVLFLAEIGDEDIEPHWVTLEGVRPGLVLTHRYTDGRRRASAGSLHCELGDTATARKLIRESDVLLRVRNVLQQPIFSGRVSSARRISARSAAEWRAAVDAVGPLLQLRVRLSAISRLEPVTLAEAIVEIISTAPVGVDIAIDAALEQISIPLLIVTEGTTVLEAIDRLLWEHGWALVETTGGALATRPWRPPVDTPVELTGSDLQDIEIGRTAEAPSQELVEWWTVYRAQTALWRGGQQEGS